jgi:hypothetical protein
MEMINLLCNSKNDVTKQLLLPMFRVFIQKCMYCVVFVFCFGCCVERAEWWSVSAHTPLPSSLHHPLYLFSVVWMCVFCVLVCVAQAQTSFRSIGTMFSKQLTSLMTLLNQTTPHFVRYVFHLGKLIVFVWDCLLFLLFLSAVS